MITIFGVPEELFKCPMCIEAVKYCTERSLEFEFIPIMYADPDPKGIGFKFDRVEINRCQSMAGKDTPPINYPQIFVDDVWIGGFKSFKEYREQNRKADTTCFSSRSIAEC